MENDFLDGTIWSTFFIHLYPTYVKEVLRSHKNHSKSYFSDLEIIYAQANIHVLTLVYFLYRNENGTCQYFKVQIALLFQ